MYELTKQILDATDGKICKNCLGRKLSKTIEGSNNIERAEKAGISTSKVKQYYAERVSENIKNYVEEKEEFYQRVKGILETEGEVSNAIGRLTDKEYFETLSYEEKQRYTLTLSEKYLRALEKFRAECEFEALRMGK